MDVGVFVLGMHRSGTSAVTRLVSLLGLATPPEEDLVQPTDKNPKGYWESEALVNFNERVLAAVGCHMSCPIRLEPGWDSDGRLDDLRRAAPQAVSTIFPTTPWVWKDPRHCLTFSFWEHVLPVRPVIVLVNRNPLEITASTLRVRVDQGRVYALALWERYLRQALEEIAGRPVIVVNYEEVLRDPLAWSRLAQSALTAEGILVREPEDEDVLDFIDAQLRHTEFGAADLERDADVSTAQRELFAAIELAAGHHTSFAASSLPPETPTTEALLAERREALRVKRELTLELQRRAEWGPRIRRRLLRALPGR